MDDIKMGDNIQVDDIQADDIKINIEKVQTTTKTIQTTTTQTIQTEIKTEIKTDGVASEKNVHPPYLYVLSDNVGYVGTYYSISDIEEITSSYHLVSFMIQCFKTSKTSDLLTIWVVLYKDIDAVAYVSNNRLDAVKVHSTLMQMGLAYMDSIDFWKQNVGLSKSAKERLDVIHSIKDKKLLDDSYNIFIQKLDLSTENMPNGPIDCIINETQKINIMDAIIPSLIPSPIKDCEEDAFEEIKDCEEDAFEEIKDCEEDAFEEIKDCEEDAFEEIKDCEEDAFEEIKDCEEDAFEEIKDCEEDEITRRIQDFEEKEKDLYSRIRAQKNNDIKFCEKCEILVSDLYNKLENIDNNEFNRLLRLFIANHCYHCFHSIREYYRKKMHASINKSINIPIDSPYVSANRDSTPKIDSKLEESVKKMVDSLNLPNGDADLSKLNVDELLSKYGMGENINNDDDDVEDVNI
jgi:hypothetical protein